MNQTRITADCAHCSKHYEIELDFEDVEDAHSTLQEGIDKLEQQRHAHLDLVHRENECRDQESTTYLYCDNCDNDWSKTLAAGQLVIEEDSEVAKYDDEARVCYICCPECEWSSGVHVVDRIVSCEHEMGEMAKYTDPPKYLCTKCEGYFKREEFPQQVANWATIVKRQRYCREDIEELKEKIKELTEVLDDHTQKYSTDKREAEQAREKIKFTIEDVEERVSNLEQGWIDEVLNKLNGPQLEGNRWEKAVDSDIGLDNEEDKKREEQGPTEGGLNCAACGSDLVLGQLCSNDDCVTNTDPILHEGFAIGSGYSGKAVQKCPSCQSTLTTDGRCFNPDCNN